MDVSGRNDDWRGSKYWKTAAVIEFVSLSSDPRRAGTSTISIEHGKAW
jgi:hypothetical protein